MNKTWIKSTQDVKRNWKKTHKTKTTTHLLAWVIDSGTGIQTSWLSFRIHYWLLTSFLSISSYNTFRVLSKKHRSNHEEICCTWCRRAVAQLILKLHHVRTHQKIVRVFLPAATKLWPRLCFYTCVWFCPQGGDLWVGRPPWAGRTPRAGRTPWAGRTPPGSIPPRAGRTPWSRHLPP